MGIDRRKFLTDASLAMGALGVGAATMGSTSAQAAEYGTVLVDGQPGPVARPDPVKKKYRLIGTEEAMSTPEQFAAFTKLVEKEPNSTNFDLRMWAAFVSLKGIAAGPNGLKARLLDIDKGRLAIMDHAGVDMHLLSLTSPGVQMFDPDTAVGVAADANDRIAETMRRHPTRFGGLASFAPQAPERAAKEIDRAMTTLKMNGLIVNSHTNGEYLDEQKFWPILEAAEANDAAIYIHPRNPPDYRHYPAAPGSLPPGTPDPMASLAGATWLFAAETSLHAMRLIVQGVFDRFPKLKIVLGHMGEGVPYWLYRMDYMYTTSHRHAAKRIKKLPSDYVRENLYITTSGMNYHPALQYAHQVLGPEHIMFAIDYPYQETVEAANFMQTAPFKAEDVELMAHGNAERVFHVKA